MSIGGVFIWGYYRLPLMSIAASAGIGGYSSALLSINGCPPYLSIALGGILTAMFGLLTGFIVDRIDRDAAVVSTFAMQICLDGFFLNSTSVTGGAMGLPGIPIIIAGSQTSPWQWQIILTLFIVITIFMIWFWRVSNSLYGRLLIAAAENEHLIASQGISPTVLGVKVFAFSHLPIGIAGGLFAHYFGYIHPTNFGVMESIFVLAIVAVGGTRSYFGAFLATIILVGAPEALRFYRIDFVDVEKLRACFVGLVLIVVSFTGFSMNKKVFVSQNIISLRNKFQLKCSNKEREL